MESKNLSTVINSVRISREKACSIMQVSPATLDQWLTGQGEPSWTQSLRLLLYLSTQLKSYGLPEEKEFDTQSIEHLESLEKEAIQASSTCDLVFQTMDEDSIHYGVTWSLSEKLKGIVDKIKQLSR